jgi:uncharacterized protein YndB with AHSA1/START domain
VSVLHLSRAFAAPRERVVAAWTDPALLRQWWAAVHGWSTSRAEVDLRPSGRYRLSMRDPAAGEEYTVTGKYLEVSLPERLVYTWTWEGEAEIMKGSEGTTVTVEFVAHGDTTTVNITHEGFADERITRLHQEGWSGCLDNLERALGKRTDSAEQQ